MHFSLNSLLSTTKEAAVAFVLPSMTLTYDFGGKSAAFGAFYHDIAYGLKKYSN